VINSIRSLDGMLSAHHISSFCRLWLQ